MIDAPPPCGIGYFRIAKEIATYSSFRIKMGAVLADKGKLICRGFNKLKSHPKYANPDLHLKISIHAEIDCLLHSKGVKGDTIYVYRENKNGTPAMARPCENCIKELRKEGIKRMYYSTSEYPYWNSEQL